LSESYDLIIGLEVHVQLLTQSKLFCGCSTRFGAPPNSQTCPVCIGMPGVLPVMNRRAFELAFKTGVALNGTIAPFTKWDRKQYYYPDLPKGYQISQYDLPFCQGGWLEISDSKDRFPPKRVELIRVHLEEDAGKSSHDEKAGQQDSLIDLNRAGTPLLEIVTQPDMRSPAEAKAFLTELKLLLTYLDVSDCNMQEGSLRVDANVNLHVHTPEGKIATPIVEVKNLNSFRAVERALEYEAGRQLEEWRETKRKLGDVPKQTRGWDDVAQVTLGQRHKEESSDYRYFPDPDLVPVTVSPKRIASERSSLGEMPASLRKRLETDWGITPYDADVLVNQGRPLVEYYLETARLTEDGKLASNWIQQDVMRTLNERTIPISQYPVSAETLADLLGRVSRRELDTARGRSVLNELVEHRGTIDSAISKLGIEMVDESATLELCRELVAANPRIADDVRSGKLQAVGSLVGQAKKKNPNVDPGQVRELCLRLIQESAP
jgi:aspartyl-tRNA(Asn)/glutamyl-tRNA(Gln) amidotransferase subunit B